MQSAGDPGVHAPEEGRDGAVRFFLIADVRGYTRFTQERGDEQAARLAARFAELTREVAAAHDGVLLELRGDEALVVFLSPRRALRAAVALQTRFVDETLEDPTLPLGVGIGVDGGEAVQVEGGYRGGALNLAARLCSAAGPGEVLASQEIVHLARAADGLRYRPRGAMTFKGMTAPVSVVEVVPELDDTSRTAAFHAALHSVRPRDAAASVSSAERLPPLLAAHAGPFVGRREALDVLRESWRRARSGQCELALVVGGAGMGKTRLARELAMSAVADGALVLAGRCDAEAAEPYQPWREALGERAGAATATTAAAAGLLVSAHDRGSGFRSPGEHEGMSDAVADLLAAAAVQRPVLLVLDDLQWADAASLRLLRHVLRATGGARILALGTCRDDDAAPTLRDALTELRRDRVFERVVLSGLQVDDVAALVQDEELHVASGTSPMALAQRIHRRSAGHPLLTAELLRHLRDGGDPAALPGGIRDVVAARAARLSPTAQDLLRRASVLGVRFDPRIVGELVDVADVTAALDEALGAGLLEEETGTSSLRFRHALVRDVLHELLPPLQRRRLHARAARALEQDGAAPAVLAVHHRASGEDVQAAVRYSIEAGRQAAGVYAVEEAIEHLDAARVLLADGQDDLLLAQVLVALGDLTYSSGIRFREGMQHLERAVALYERLGLPEAAAKARSRLGRAYSSYFEEMDLTAALRHLTAAEQVLRDTGDGVGLGLVLVGLANARYWSWEVLPALAAAEEAEQLALRSGRVPAVTAARAMRGRLLCHRGRLDEGLALLDEAWEIAEQERLLDVAYFITVFTSEVAHWRLDLRGAEAVLSRGLDVPGIGQAPRQAEQLQLFLASVQISRGDVVGTQARLPHVGINRTFIADYELPLARGDWPRAFASMDVFLSMSSSRQHRYTLGGTPLLLEEQPRLLQHLERELPHSREDLLGHVSGRCAVGLGLARTGRHEQARVHTRTAAELLASEQDWGGLPAMVSLAEAEIACAAGDVEQALQHSDLARTAFRDRGAVWLEAEALLAAARATAAVQPASAARRVGEAVELYRRIGAGARWSERAAAVLHAPHGSAAS